MFSPDEIKKAIASDLSTDINIPDGHRGALVTFINNDKAELALATKVNDHWSIELVGSHSFDTDDNSVGAISKITW